MADATTLTVQGDGSVQTKTYALTTADPNGSAIMMPEWSDKTFSVTGTWGGATCVLEGSNDGVTYQTLRDPQGVVLSFTANGIKQVLESPLYVKPTLSVVGSGATLTAILLVRRPNPMRT